MGFTDSAYTNPDMIEALYNDPTNEILLAEFLLQTGGVQLGVFSANLGASNPPPEIVVTGGGIPCFTGENLVTLFHGVRVPIAELYDNRREYIGKGARSFTPDNFIVPGEIRDVYRTRVYELLHVNFENEPDEMRMRREHRFWRPRRTFKPMHAIRNGRKVMAYDGEWSESVVENKKLVKYPEGVDVYNLLIGIYHNYMIGMPGVKAKAVSNAKLPPE